MGIKDLVLNKGWAGKTMTRQDTAERLNLLMRPIIELMYCYEQVLGTSDAQETLSDIEAVLPDLRADIGKIGETIHSCGLPAYSGTDLNAAHFASDLKWAAVLEREEAFFKLLEEEHAHEHHMRTRAVLGAVATNSETRQQLVKKIL